MTRWAADELEKIETADELQNATLRSDGTMGSKRTIWVVRVDDDLYVRSAGGPDRPVTTPRTTGSVT